MTNHTLPQDADEATTFETYAGMKKGDLLAQGQYTYRAKGDAVLSEAHGYDRVFVEAERMNPAMPSGWELADLGASWKRGSGPARTLTGDTVLRIEDRATKEVALKTLDGFLADNDVSAFEQAQLRRALGSYIPNRWGYAYYVIWYAEDPACAYEVSVEEAYRVATEDLDER